MEDKKNKIDKIIDYFENDEYKDKKIVKTELNYNNHYELLIAIILSAQCKDSRINEISPKLFEKYKNFEELSKANHDNVFELIKSISYPKEKTERIINVSKIIFNKYDSEIPNNLNKLVEIKGIGRKTANLVLSIIYDYPGIAVDTHVNRVSNRLNLVNSKNPDIIEKELMMLFPQKYYNKINPWFVMFGRYKCKALKPECNNCKLKDICNLKK